MAGSKTKFVVGSALSGVLAMGMAGCMIKAGAGAALGGPAPGGEPTSATAPVAGCPEEIGGVDAPDTVAGALALEPGVLQGCSGLEDSGDFFALSAPVHTGPVLYRVELVGAEMQSCLRGLNADKEVIPGMDSCSDDLGAPYRVWTTVQGGTQWYLRVGDLRGNGMGLAQPYTLKVEAFPINDPGEPDSAARPTALALGQTQASFFVSAANAPNSERDYFLVTVPKEGKKSRLKVVIADVGPEVQTVLKVFNTDKEVVDEQTASNPGANLRADVKLRGPGTYLLEMWNINGSGTAQSGKNEPAGHVLRPYSITATIE